MFDSGEITDVSRTGCCRGADSSVKTGSSPTGAETGSYILSHTDVIKRTELRVTLQDSVEGSCSSSSDDEGEDGDDGGDDDS